MSEESHSTLHIHTSPTVVKVFSALAKFSANGIAFVAQSENPHFKSAYAMLPFVLHMVSKQLVKAGLVIVQGGTMVESQFAVVTRMCHTSGEWIETVMPIQPSARALERDASQAYASAMTYGRRIALLSILGLAPVDPKEKALLEVDDDGNAAAGKDNPESKDTQNNPSGMKKPDAKPKKLSKKKSSPKKAKPPRSEPTQPQPPLSDEDGDEFGF